jgi:hypothetical protein
MPDGTPAGRQRERPGWNQVVRRNTGTYVSDHCPGVSASIMPEKILHKCDDFQAGIVRSAHKSYYSNYDSKSGLRTILYKKFRIIP